MDRATFVEHQVDAADRKLGFASGEEARERFLQLAAGTYDALTSAGADRVWAFDTCEKAPTSPSYTISIMYFGADRRRDPAPKHT